MQTNEVTSAGYPTAAVRIRAMKRDKFTCQYCGISGSEAELEIDHIVPLSTGGSNHISNLATACRKCNQEKSNKDAKFLLSRSKTIPFKNTSSIHALVDMWFHTYCDQNELDLQGHIVGVDENVVFAQLFSWLTGDPTEVRLFDKFFIYSNKCKLYKQRNDWLRAQDEFLKKDRTKYKNCFQRVNVYFDSEVERFMGGHHGL